MSGEMHSGVQDIIIPETITAGFGNEEIVDIEDLKKTPLACDVCNVKVTSSKILQRHLEGRKHKLRLERTGKCFRCELCDVLANSETQLHIHLNSSKHKARILKREYAEFTDISTNSKSIWIIVFCVICIFVNLLLLFKVVL